MHFADALMAEIKKKESVVCIGLDPVLSKLPSFLVEKHAQNGHTLKAAAAAFLEFNKGIIDATKDVAVAVKPQLAYFEVLGHEGLRVFEETCRYAHERELLVIADGKRNDIGLTAEAYAQAYFGGAQLFEDFTTATEVDALTTNAYLGLDGIKPFLPACGRDKGMFVLVRTSNPSSGDFQDRILKDENMSVSELMARFVDSWGSDCVGKSGFSSVGAVVGATYPAEAAKLRTLMPQSLFLVPGYGAQGGGVADTKPCFDSNGMGAIVVNARGIIYAYQEKDGGKGEHFMDSARASASQMRAALNAAR